MRLMEEFEKSQKRSPTEEQKDIIALFVLPMQHAFDARANREDLLLPVDVPLVDILIDGGGGCGKTMLLNLILIPLFKTFFGIRGVQMLSPSNKGARGVGGRTCHSASGLTPENSLRTAALAPGTEKLIKLEKIWVPVGVLGFEEYSQLQAVLNHAIALLLAYARRSAYKLNPYDYATLLQRMGRVSILFYCGDHLQLPPVPKTSSLLAPMQGAGQEHKVGAAVFSNVKYVYQMAQMMRFTDDTLINILRKMRAPGGMLLREDEWKALCRTSVSEVFPDGTKPTLDGTADWYNCSYVWSVVSMAAFVQARRSAKSAQQTLFHIQAIDVPAGSLPAARDVQSRRHIFEDMLREPNVSKTKKLPGIVSIHYGMHMRFTGTVDPKVVQDMTGIVVGIDFDPSDSAANACAGVARTPGEVKLSCMPSVVYLKLDGSKDFFLPVTPCREHCAVGSDPHCEACARRREELEGVFAVRPIQRTWNYSGPCVDGEYVKVKRLQFPLMPALALTLYSMQGVTADPGLIAFWQIPKRLTSDIKWLIVYVMLSRVRSLGQLRSVGLSPAIRAIIESGAPSDLVQTFDKLFKDKISETKIAAKEARKILGWS